MYRTHVRIEREDVKAEFPARQNCELMPDLSAAIAASAFAALAARCGGEQACRLTARPGSTATGTIPGGADPAKVAGDRRLGATLRRGDIDGAAGYFAIPSVAENGPALIHDRDPGDARLFNASLPCGATPGRCRSGGRVHVATFRLTERPGPGICGPGPATPRRPPS